MKNECVQTCTKTIGTMSGEVVFELGGAAQLVISSQSGRGDEAPAGYCHGPPPARRCVIGNRPRLIAFLVLHERSAGRRCTCGTSDDSSGGAGQKNSTNPISDLVSVSFPFNWE